MVEYKVTFNVDYDKEWKPQDVITDIGMGLHSHGIEHTELEVEEIKV